MFQVLRIVEGGKSELSEKDQMLYDDIKHCIASFDIIKEEAPEMDISKNYLVMAYNLLELGLDTEGMVQVDKISRKYWAIDFLKDMQFSIDRRNEMIMLKGDAEREDRFKICRMESEFFICGVGIQEHLVDKEFKLREDFDTMVEEFNEIEYLLLEDKEDGIEGVPECGLRVIEEEPEEDK